MKAHTLHNRMMHYTNAVPVDHGLCYVRHTLQPLCASGQDDAVCKSKTGVPQSFTDRAVCLND